MIGHQARFRGNDELPLWRGPAAKKKPLLFNAPALITRRLCAVGIRNSILGNNLNPEKQNTAELVDVKKSYCKLKKSNLPPPPRLPWSLC